MPVREDKATRRVNDEACGGIGTWCRWECRKGKKKDVIGTVMGIEYLFARC